MIFSMFIFFISLIIDFFSFCHVFDDDGDELIDNFRWIDTVISLNGVCKISDICQGDQYDHDLERIHIVIGGRIIDKDRSYGLALYDLNDDGDGKLRLLDRKSLDSTLLTRLNRTGLDINMLEREGSIMYGSFWPSQNGKLIHLNMMNVFH